MEHTRYMEFEGFGRIHTGEEWAELLDISVDTFRYFTEQKGLTVEDMYKLKGVLYTEPKKRKGYRLVETRKRIDWILLRSGYPTHDLEITAAVGGPIHRIALDGESIGRYFYKEDRLVLNNGEGFYLADLEECEAVLRQGRNGWEWHPEARQAGFKVRLK